MTEQCEVCSKDPLRCKGQHNHYEIELWMKLRMAHTELDVSRLREWANMPWWKRMFASGSSLK